MMDDAIDYNELKVQILRLKALAEDLGDSGKMFPAIACNITRIKASVKMLELNVVDGLEITENDMKS